MSNALDQEEKSEEIHSGDPWFGDHTERHEGQNESQEQIPSAAETVPKVAERNRAHHFTNTPEGQSKAHAVVICAQAFT